MVGSLSLKMFGGTNHQLFHSHRDMDEMKQKDEFSLIRLLLEKKQKLEDFHHLLSLKPNANLVFSIIF